ncbi:hypothetical protein BKA70DRAFT_1436404 [Coprinopsis sp. MPI-PUGE-AT-0042]|nr:hypothetical protein BKA70DRAFT_1436404 [Coprinopsis sp. MPI-PUGE-AT-0042]
MGQQSGHALRQQAIREKAWDPLQSLVVQSAPLEPSQKPPPSSLPLCTSQWTEDPTVSGKGTWYSVSCPRVGDQAIFAIIYDESPNGMVWTYVHIQPGQDKGHVLSRVIAPPLTSSEFHGGRVSITGPMIAECLMQGLDIAEPVYLCTRFADDASGDDAESLITWTASASNDHQVTEYREDTPFLHSSCPTTPTQERH